MSLPVILTTLENPETKPNHRMVLQYMDVHHEGLAEVMILLADSSVSLMASRSGNDACVFEPAQAADFQIALDNVESEFERAFKYRNRANTHERGLEPHQTISFPASKEIMAHPNKRIGRVLRQMEATWRLCGNLGSSGASPWIDDKEAALVTNSLTQLRELSIDIFGTGQPTGDGGFDLGKPYACPQAVAHPDVDGVSTTYHVPGPGVPEPPHGPQPEPNPSITEGGLHGG